MGIHWTILMQEDFDWHYADRSQREIFTTSREQELTKFEREWENLHGRKPNRLGAWYGMAVYDIRKRPPDAKDTNTLIFKYCERCFYWEDNTPWVIESLENIANSV